MQKDCLLNSVKNRGRSINRTQVLCNKMQKNRLDWIEVKFVTLQCYV